MPDDTTATTTVETAGGLSRRALIGAGAGLAASAAVLATRPGSAAGSAARAVGDGDVVSLLPKERIGLQLYSVRDEISSVGFEKVFENLAAIGFKHVEFAGYTQGTGDITVQQLRQLLDKYGLKGAGSHVTATDEASMTKILDDAQVLGLPYVGNSLVLPSGAPTVDGWKGAAADANRYGEMAAKRGIKYYLHNHFQEWSPCVDNPMQRGMDVLLAECDPSYAFLELDIFWAYVGAAQNSMAFDPLNDYILKFADRFKLFHVKDGIYDDRPAGTITDVGQGKVDFQQVFSELFKLSPDQPSKHLYLFENDNGGQHPRGALASAQTSYAHLRYALTKSASAAAPGASTPSVAECTTTSGLTAAINRIRFRRTKAGGRALAIGLRLGGDAKVSVRLTRSGRTLARASERLGNGSPTLTVVLPGRIAAGAAVLTVRVSDGSGTDLTVRRPVRVPSARKRG